ncbi:deoxyribose-phosphate aldolase, partial [Methylobacterium trifolii]
AYLALADRIMGPGWVGPATFRLGASSLFPVLMAARA